MDVYNFRTAISMPPRLKDLRYVIASLGEAFTGTKSEVTRFGYLFGWDHPAFGLCPGQMLPAIDCDHLARQRRRFDQEPDRSRDLGRIDLPLQRQAGPVGLELL